MAKFGLYPTSVARRIYLNAGGGSLTEFKEHTRPPAKGGGVELFRAVMKAAWSASKASCDIYSIDGATFTDTGIDADVYDGLAIFASLTTGDSLLVLKQAGKYYAIQAPCP